MNRTITLSVGLAVLGLAAGADGIGSQVAAPPVADRAPPAPDRSRSDEIPILRKAPRLIELAQVDGHRAQPVTLMGEHFSAGASVTLSSLLYVSTFGPASLSNVTSTSLQLDAAYLEEGTYAVSVQNPSGLRSNELILTVSRR